MKRFAIILLLAMASVALGNKVLRAYSWNGCRYCVVQQDDGSRIEIRGGPKMTDAEALAKVPTPAELPVVVAEKTTLVGATVKELTAEIKRRKLTSADLGLSETSPVAEKPK